MGLFSSEETIPATGFYTMPKSYQKAYNSMLGQLNKVLLPGGKVNTEMFTPLPQTADETQALEMIRQGLTPDEGQLRSDISMLMNPYDDYVIDDINRQAQGQASILNQQLRQTGQMGSNRSILGASDIESQRLGQIGQFRQGQYNTAVDRSLGALSGLRQQDISNLMGSGTFERGLDTATRQAPYTALQAAQGGLGNVQTSGWNFGAPEQTVKSGTGLGSTLGAAAGFAVGGPVGAAIGGGIGGGFEASTYGGNVLGGALSGAVSGYTGNMGGGMGGGNPMTSLLSSTGLSGGYDPISGINWNTGRQGGSFFI